MNANSPIAIHSNRQPRAQVFIYDDAVDRSGRRLRCIFVVIMQADADGRRLNANLPRA